MLLDTCRLCYKCKTKKMQVNILIYTLDIVVFIHLSDVHITPCNCYSFAFVFVCSLYKHVYNMSIYLGKCIYAIKHNNIYEYIHVSGQWMEPIHT